MRNRQDDTQQVYYQGAGKETMTDFEKQKWKGMNGIWRESRAGNRGARILGEAGPDWS